VDSDGDVAATVMSAVEVGSPRVVRRRVGAGRLYPKINSLFQKNWIEKRSADAVVGL